MTADPLLYPPSPFLSPLLWPRLAPLAAHATLQFKFYCPRRLPGDCTHISDPVSGKRLNVHHLTAGLWMPFRTRFPIAGVFAWVLSWDPKPPQSWGWGWRGGNVLVYLVFVLFFHKRCFYECHRLPEMLCPDLRSGPDSASNSGECIRV